MFPSLFLFLLLRVFSSFFLSFSSQCFSSLFFLPLYSIFLLRFLLLRSSSFYSYSFFFHPISYLIFPSYLILPFFPYPSVSFSHFFIIHSSQPFCSLSFPILPFLLPVLLLCFFLFPLFILLSSTSSLVPLLSMLSHSLSISAAHTQLARCFAILDGR